MAWTPPSPGELRESVRFEARTGASNDGGVVRADWVVVVPRRRVRLLPVLGGEQTIADRATGVDRWTLDVWACSQVRTLNADMRVVDTRDETRVFNILSVLDLEGRDRWRTLTLEMGGSDG